MLCRASEVQIFQNTALCVVQNAKCHMTTAKWGVSTLLRFINGCLEQTWPHIYLKRKLTQCLTVKQTHPKFAGSCERELLTYNKYETWFPLLILIFHLCNKLHSITLHSAVNETCATKMKKHIQGAYSSKAQKHTHSQNQFGYLSQLTQQPFANRFYS